MAKDRLQKGIYARTPKGFQENIKTMEKAGYDKKRAVGTAYGEADRDIKKQEERNGMQSLDSLMKKIKSL